MTPTPSMILNFVFFTLGVIFQTLKRIIPERKINLKSGFSKDILTFFLLSLFGVFLSTLLIQFYRELDLSFLAIIHSQNSVNKIILATLITDFFNYWIHFHMHTQNWFWKTYIHHHRIEELYWSLGLRASLGDSENSSTSSCFKWQTLKKYSKSESKSAWKEIVGF